MNYEAPFSIFNSSGDWIGFCLGRNLFDTDTVWRGWFPWDTADAVNTQGRYLGTIVGNRFYRFESKEDLQVGYYPGYPPIPTLPERPRRAVAKRPPLGAADVNLKADALPPLGKAAQRKAGNFTGRTARRQTRRH